VRGGNNRFTQRGATARGRQGGAATC